MAGARYAAEFWRERQHTLWTPAAIGRSVRRPQSAALAIAGRVPLKSRKCRGNHAGPGHGETADGLPDLSQQALNLFSAITNAIHPTREFHPFERQKAGGGGWRSRNRARVVARRNGKPTAKIWLEMKKDLGARPLSP